MIRRLLAAWRAFWHPNEYAEALKLVAEMYDWTNHQGTTWAQRAKRLLGRQ